MKSLFIHHPVWILILIMLVHLSYSIEIYRDQIHNENGSLVKDRKAQLGKRLYQRHNCSACHQIYGLGGYMGPDLTNVVSGKGSAYAAAFLKNGTVRMPNFYLSEEEIDYLLAYLKQVDKTGRFPLKGNEFRVHWSGTIDVP